MLLRYLVAANYLKGSKLVSYPKAQEVGDGLQRVPNLRTKQHKPTKPTTQQNKPIKQAKNPTKFQINQIKTTPKQTYTLPHQASLKPLPTITLENYSFRRERLIT